MSIELPPIPAIPAADAPASEWTRYLSILSAHATADSAAATREQTAQMVLMTAAVNHQATLQQQFLDLPQTASEGFSEAGVLSLVTLLMRLPPEAP